MKLSKILIQSEGTGVISLTIDLSKYVSNLDKNVYAIYNLPEEVIAVIFAYVSRSPLSFRDNLAKLLADEELATTMSDNFSATTFSHKAALFHEKWVVGYGHSSVAEHAVAHVGIEKISRLASAELELANTFNSFTEYSQRYQRPKRGDIYLPIELQRQPELKTIYLSFHTEVYDCYEELMKGLRTYLLENIPKKSHESEKQFATRVEKIAFEDARYVLPLSVLTNLGMTGNGRALRDTLVRLLSSPYLECHQLAKQLETEVSKVIPTLLKYVRPSEYLLITNRMLTERFKEQKQTLQEARPSVGPSARFVALPDYKKTLQQLATALLLRQLPMSFTEAEEQALSYTLPELEQIAADALSELRFFDNPVDELSHLTYQMEITVSEANWHQLLRHNRKTHFTYTRPTIRFGYTIPPNIREAGLTEPFERIIEQAEKVYQKLASFQPNLADYCVTNAHHRQIFATASLWELYHLINLRTSAEAQWDIRQTFTQLHQSLAEHHPVLARFAARRY